MTDTPDSFVKKLEQKFFRIVFGGKYRSDLGKFGRENNVYVKFVDIDHRIKGTPDMVEMIAKGTKRDLNKFRSILKPFFDRCTKKNLPVLNRRVLFLCDRDYPLKMVLFKNRGTPLVRTKLNFLMEQRREMNSILSFVTTSSRNATNNAKFDGNTESFVSERELFRSCLIPGIFSILKKNIDSGICSPTKTFFEFSIGKYFLSLNGPNLFLNREVTVEEIRKEYYKKKRKKALSLHFHPAFTNQPKLDLEVDRRVSIVREYGGFVNHLAPLFDTKFESFVIPDFFLQNLSVKLSLNVLHGMANYQRIPNRNACLVMGVYDPTGTLKEGEVYVAVSRTLSHDDLEIFECNVIVGRNPCHHQGDLRILKAVKNEKLSYLRNVIVFSVQGSYPEFLKCSGGDLDGDLYTVFKISDDVAKNLQQKPFYQDQSSYNPTEKTIVKPDHLVNFFVQHMYFSNIGRMSNKHLAVADLYGIEDPCALLFAKKCRISVDYSSNGIVSRITSEEKESVESFREKTKMVPDFFFKSHRSDRVISDTVLGKLYRVLSKREISIVTSREQEEYCGDESVRVDQKFVYRGWEKHVDEVTKIYRIYKTSLLDVIERYRLKNEFEIMGNHRRIFSKELFHITTMIRSCIDLFEDIQYKGKNEEEEEENKEVGLFEKLSCAYVVCYRDAERVKEKYRVLSFPWVIGGEKWIKYFEKIML